MRSRGWATGAAGFALVLAGSLIGSLGTTGAAAATSCSSITIAQGQGLSLEVSSVLVYTGGCVRFANLTDVTVTVRVSGSSFSSRLPARTPASASASYVATHSATVTATDGIRSGHGSISVEAPPPTPKATQTFIPPPVVSDAPTTPTHSPKPPPTPTASASVTPTATTPTPSPSHTPSSAVIPTLPPLPSGGSSVPPAASHPVVAPQLAGRRGSQLAATVVEPVGGPSRGLPAAVAVVIVVGLATAFGRAVLAAVPAVDRRGRRTQVPL